MNKDAILSTLKNIVKGSVIEFHASENYSILKGDDGKLYKNDKGELIWEHNGKELDVKNLLWVEDFSLLFDLLLSNKAISYDEYTLLVSFLL